MSLPRMQSESVTYPSSTPFLSLPQVLTPLTMPLTIHPSVNPYNLHLHTQHAAPDLSPILSLKSLFQRLPIRHLPPSSPPLPKLTASNVTLASQGPWRPARTLDTSMTSNLLSFKRPAPDPSQPTQKFSRRLEPPPPCSPRTPIFDFFYAHRVGCAVLCLCRAWPYVFAPVSQKK